MRFVEGESHLGRDLGAGSKSVTTLLRVAFIPLAGIRRERVRARERQRQRQRDRERERVRERARASERESACGRETEIEGARGGRPSNKSSRETSTHSVASTDVFSASAELPIYALRALISPSHAVGVTSSSFQADDMDSLSDVIRIKQGLIQGRQTTTKSGRPLISFQGIPYAKPPIGPLRFKPPSPPDPWDGIYKAETEGPICVQIENGEVVGQEDCLYLNVYSQDLKPKTLKPVMFWIHGGGFVIGSGNTDLFGPDYLIDAGVVLITINYRLGVLGFASLDNDDISGNMGLKDQVAALQWVQENIVSFGGDPKNVTIFGESAGGVCVNYHMLSPITKGLFHKAIAQSGSALNPWAYTTQCRPRTFKLGELLGLKTKNEKELYQFLMNTEVDQLVKESGNVLARRDNTSALKIVFVPTVEPSLPNQTPYLTKSPEHLMSNGQFHPVPFITGTVTHEGMVNLYGVLRKPAILNKLNESFEKIIPGILRSSMSKTKLEETVKKVRKFYFNDAPISMDNISAYLDYNTDIQMAIGIYKTAKYFAASSTKCPIYFYNFEYDGELGCAKKVLGDLAAFASGPAHADDIGYLFRLGIYDLDLDPESTEVKVRNTMITLWTDFAKTGNPTPHCTKQIPIEWIPFSTTNQKYLVINENLQIDSYPRRERMMFWEDIYHHSKL